MRWIAALLICVACRNAAPAADLSKIILPNMAAQMANKNHLNPQEISEGSQHVQSCVPQRMRSMQKDVLTVKSIPELPVRICQLFLRPPKVAKSYGGQINENSLISQNPSSGKNAGISGSWDGISRGGSPLHSKHDPGRAATYQQPMVCNDRVVCHAWP